MPRLGAWDEARKALEQSYKAGAFDAATAERYRAVLETAAAMQIEARDPQAAVHLAHLALKRRPNFVPALLVATRILIARNDPKLATKLIEKAWPNAPHPDLAAAYLNSFPTETNAQKLVRAERLAAFAPQAPESRQALAQAALAARAFAKARSALAPLIAEGKTPTAHTCLLMAEIEDAEFGPSGPVREWLARASRAPRDPAWIADGVVSRSWAPISPKTGRLDAFEWAAAAPPGRTGSGRRSGNPSGVSAPASGRGHRLRLRQDLNRGPRAAAARKERLRRHGGARPRRSRRRCRAGPAPATTAARAGAARPRRRGRSPFPSR